MDNRIQLNEEVLRGKFILPADASITAVSDLEETTQKQIAADAPTDLAVTRTSVRAPSKIIDEKLGELIATFRSPTSIPVAIAGFCKDDPNQASQVLEHALPILLDLVRHSILVSEFDKQQELIDFTIDVGQQFEEYTVVQKIQLFSESEVYQVRDAESRELALKITRPDCGDRITQQLQQEFSVLTTLSLFDHSVLCSGNNGELFWFVMPWIRGARADQVCREYRDQNDRAGLLAIIQNLAKQYAELHASGFFHGDVHPGNILIDGLNGVHILDFGAANANDNSSLKQSRAGVAFYFEPEYAKAILNGERPPSSSAKGEQFSIAALIYFLATGNHYDDFELEQHAMYSSIANAQPKPFTAQGVDGWPQLERILVRALSVKPQDRFDSVEDFAQALAECVLCDAAPSNHLDREAEPFLEQFLETLDVDSALYSTPFDYGPCCSVNGGAAGIAYALLKLAGHDEDPHLLNSAEFWLARAERDQNKDDAFMNIKHAREYEMVSPVSLHHAEPGIQFIKLLQSIMKNDLAEFEAGLNFYLKGIEPNEGSIDTTLGQLSTLLGNLELIQHSKFSEASEVTALFEDTTNVKLDSIWASFKNTASIGEGNSWHNLGFAHGWAGLLYCTAAWHKETGYELPAEYFLRVDQLTSRLKPKGRGLAVDWIDESGNAMGTMSGWCNGSAGLLHLHCMLYELDQNDRWLRVAQDLAWNVWENQASPVDLCCGNAGRVFALLRFSKIIEGSQDWHYRAGLLLSDAISRAPQMDDEEHPSHSLFKGQLGLALATKAWLSKGELSMPLMGMA